MPRRSRSAHVLLLCALLASSPAFAVEITPEAMERYGQYGGSTFARWRKSQNRGRRGPRASLRKFPCTKVSTSGLSGARH